MENKSDKKNVSLLTLDISRKIQLNRFFRDSILKTMERRRGSEFFGKFCGGKTHRLLLEKLKKIFNYLKMEGKRL